MSAEQRVINTVQIDKYYSECRKEDSKVTYNNVEELIKELDIRKIFYDNCYDKLDETVNINDTEVKYVNEKYDKEYMVDSFKAIYEVINLSQINFINIIGSDFEKCFKQSYKVNHDNVNKLYIDVENIHDRKPDEFLNKLINDFIKYIKSNNNYLFKYNYSNNELINVVKNDEINNIDTSYVITKNIKSSSHDGLSYHVIFSNIVIENGNYIRNILKNFIMLHKEYFGCIDLSVYTKRRLFRLPYNHNCLNYKYQYKAFTANEKVIYEKDVHIPQIKEDNGEIDFKKYIITYLDNTKDKEYYLIMYAKNIDTEFNEFRKANQKENIKDSADFNFDEYLKKKLNYLFDKLPTNENFDKDSILNQLLESLNK